MNLDGHTLLWLAGITCLSSCVQGFTGLGFALVGMGFCSKLLGPRDANVLWTLLGALLVTSMAVRLRTRIAWRLVLYMFVGSLVGIPLGVLLLATASPAFLNRFIGGAIVAFAVYYVFNPEWERTDLSSFWGLPAGAASGFMGALTNMSGPPVLIFLMLSGQKKDELKATLAFFFSLITIYKIVVLTQWKGLVNSQHLVAALLLAGPLLGGMAGGMCAARAVSTRTMRQIICGLLVVPGVLLLIQ